MLVDDHEILSYSPITLQHPQITPPPDLGRRLLVDEPALGRLRPTYYLARMGEIALLGDRPLAWHALRLAMAVGAAALLYGVFRAAGVGIVPSAFFGAWLLVAPGVSSIWIRLGPAETIGTLLLVASAWSAGRSTLPRASSVWEWGSLAAAIAAMLSKESFIFAMPALAGLRLYLRYLRGGWPALGSRRALWPPALLLAATLAAGGAALLIARSAGTTSYGGAYLDTGLATYGRNILVSLVVLAKLGGWLAPVLLAGFALLVVQRRCRTQDVGRWGAATALALLLVLPQVLLYARGGVLVERYILPAGLGMAAGLTAILGWFQLHRHRRLFLVGALLWGEVLVLGGLATWMEADAFRADALQLERLVTTIATSAPRNAVVGIAADPADHYEKSISLLYHLAHTGRSDLDIRLLPVRPGHAYTVAEEAYSDTLRGLHFRGQADLAQHGCEDLAAVILLASEASAREALPCLQSTGLGRVDFVAPVYVWDPIHAASSLSAPQVSLGYSLLLAQQKAL